ncbi:hypothetical protein D3C85_830290 [compost metagenome]
MRHDPVRHGKGDIVGDAAGKQGRFLFHHGHLAPQLRHAQHVRIDAVELQAARVYLVVAQHQAGDGGLARARSADQGDFFARADGQADAVEGRHLGALGVGKTHVAQRDMAGQRRLRRRFGHGAVAAQDLEDAVGRAHRAHPRVPEFADGAGRVRHHAGIDDEGRQLAHAQAALADQVGAEAQGGQQGNEGEQALRALEHGQQPRAGQGHAQQLAHRLRVAGHGAALLVERLHQARMGKVFLRHLAAGGQGGGNGPRALPVITA